MSVIKYPASLDSVGFSPVQCIKHLMALQINKPHL